jgi:hypothetical protein
MNSLVEKIMNVDKAVRELYASMIEMLNQEDMDYKIEFQDKVFDFWAPLTQEEKYEMDRNKHNATTALLKDALEKLINTSYAETSNIRSGPTLEGLLTFVWINIANLQRATKKQDQVSTIVSTESYSVDEGSSKDLDYDSIYIQAQRKDLSDEEKWDILLRSFVDKKPVVSEQSE